MWEIKAFLKSEDGATSVEYALIASAITAVIAVTVFALGTKVFNFFNNYAASY